MRSRVDSELKQRDGQTGRQTHTHTYLHTHTQSRKTDRQTGRQAGRQTTDTQTDRRTATHKILIDLNNICRITSSDVAYNLKQKQGAGASMYHL
jgi:N-formylglutamate amidohydrolase